MARIAARWYVWVPRERFSLRPSGRTDVSSVDRGRRKRGWLGTVGGAAIGSCGAVFYFLEKCVEAADESISIPSYPWSFNGTLASLDHSAIRRGWQVYRSVCRTCHSLRYVRFLDLVSVSHTEEEVKAIAAEFEVEDGPDEEGNNYRRAAKPADRVPSPYRNEQEARMANFGAYPQDLTYVVQTRRNGTNYVFSLLTGFTDPPAGVVLEENQHFNVYFPGCVIGMPQMLHDGIIEYDDGTPATRSQMAKDIVEFLSWTSSQEHDIRKLMFLKVMGILAIMLIAALRANRYYWSRVRSQQIAYVPKFRG